ncbi:MAG: hypothetical protein AB7E28_02625, partial [Desulfurella sp.]
MSNTQQWSATYTQLLDQNNIKESYLSYFSDDYKLNIEPQEALIDTQAILDVTANQKKQVRLFKQN